ncbi:MAG TPA: nuclear transport factor 2 family protein [Rubrobacteraceae bacterium]|nr:nuclear transport factor 2 family protein [Rubrobacteraceae bacterium]
MVTRASGGLDIGELRRAIEERDLERMLSFYDDDAEILTVDRNAPPSAPHELRGKAAITEYLKDIFGREMTHRVENEVVGEDRIAFAERCEYPDGTKVLALETCELRDGKILRQVGVQVWDE